MSLFSLRYTLALLGFAVCFNNYASEQPITPITPISFDENKAQLGEILFFDPLLSKDNSISCASCHLLIKYHGTDGKRLAIGVANATGSRNTPTVYNAALNHIQNWDGAARTLEKQAAMAITNPKEMASNFDELITKLSQSKKYSELFESVYRGRINKRTITKSLAEFQKKLLTMNSPFDRYLQGETQAISEKARKGYQKFKSFGCSGCHQGANVGGNLLQKFGIHENPRTKGDTNDDLGRYSVTQLESDRHVFKVPSLRLAVHTAPYFHDGSVPTIEKAVELMFLYQVGRKIKTVDRDHIIEFLKTLPGELYQNGESRQ